MPKSKSTDTSPRLGGPWLLAPERDLLLDEGFGLQHHCPLDHVLELAARLLYFHSARADQLLHDAVTEILVPLQARGLVDIDVQDLQRHLSMWVDEGKTVGHWSEPTITRITRGLLSALRDFGVLQGAVNKKIAPAYLPIESFAYVVFYFKQHQPSGAKLIELPDWKLFFLRREGVERLLFEAHQHELLEYHVAGSVTRLTFPAETLEEYANVLAQR